MGIRTVLMTTAAVATCLACRAPEPADPFIAIFAARTTSVSQFLDRLAQLEDTRIGRRARELRAALPKCRAVGAWVPEPDAAALLAGLRCIGEDSRLVAFDRLRGNRDFALDWQLDNGESVRVRVDFDRSEDADVELLLPRGTAHGAGTLLVPGPDSPGPAQLTGTDALVHVRLRPRDGIDLTALVAGDPRAQQLFRLKSRFLASTIFDGTWEAAIYLPTPGEAAPPLALALGFRSRTAAIAAMEELIETLRSTWPVARTEFSANGAPGTCLPNLRIMPDLAPCYVATDRALVIGWNGASVERALAGGAPGLNPVGGLLVELARLAEADSNLTGMPVTGAQMPWTRLHAVGREEKDGVRVRVHLEARRGT